MSWRRAAGTSWSLVVLTVAVFLLEIVPLELQRRIVNDLVKHRDYWLIIVLCAVYAGTVLVQGGTKLVLNVYRSWVGERAIRDLRRRVHVLVSSPSAASSAPEAEGIQASMIVAEVESIGGFVGGEHFRTPAAGRHPRFPCWPT